MPTALVTQSGASVYKGNSTITDCHPRIGFAALALAFVKRFT